LTSVSAPRPNILRAALWTILSCLLVVAYTSTAKHLSADGLPVAVIVFFRCLFGVVFLIPWLVKNGVAGLKTEQPVLMVSRGINTMLGLYCLFTAVSLMPLADVVAIQYTKPVFAALAAVLVLREVMTGSRWTGIFIAIAGMLVIVRPGMSDLNIGVLLAIGAMISGAYTTITVKFLTRTEPPDRIVAYMVLGMTVASAIPAIWFWQMPTLDQLFWLAFAGFVANGYQQTMARGFSLADATAVMPFEFSRLIFAAVIGYLAFSESVDAATLVGGVIIFVSGLYMVRTEKKR